MPKIKFFVTREVRDGTGTVFEAGKVYDVSVTSAERWIRRGVAETVVEEAVFEPPEVPPEPLEPLKEATPELSETTDALDDILGVGDDDDILGGSADSEGVSKRRGKGSRR